MPPYRPQDKTVVLKKPGKQNTNNSFVIEVSIALGILIVGVLIIFGLCLWIYLSLVNPDSLLLNVVLGPRKVATATLRVNNSTPRSTRIFSPSNTLIPPTLCKINIIITANSAVNIRQGPGREFLIVKTAYPGEVLSYLGENVLGTWIQISMNEWVLASLVRKTTC